MNPMTAQSHWDERMSRVIPERPRPVQPALTRANRSVSCGWQATRRLSAVSFWRRRTCEPTCDRMRLLLLFLIYATILSVALARRGLRSAAGATKPEPEPDPYPTRVL